MKEEFIARVQVLVGEVVSIQVVEVVLEQVLIQNLN